MEWRKIPGFQGYEASDSGLIRPTNPRYKNGRGVDGLRPWIVNRWGRQAAYVTLHIDGARTKCLVHRLVCLAFHGPEPDGDERIDCCHKDHNSLNNRAANLRWDTHKNNIDEMLERHSIQEEALAEELARGDDASTPF